MSQTALQGNLSTFSFEDVLNFVEEKRQTGILEIDQPEDQRKVYFQKGKLICLSGLLNGSSVASLLYRKGTITREQFEQLSHMESDELIAALQSMLDFTAPEVKDDFDNTLSILFTEEVVDLFSMPEGNFQFLLQDLQCPQALQMVMDVAQLQEQGRQLRAQWNEILDAVPNWNLYPQISDFDKIELEQFQPETEQWQVLSTVNGRSSVKDLTLLSPSGRFATLSALAHFNRQGIVVFNENPLPKPERWTKTGDILDVPQETASFLDSFRTKDHAKSYQPQTTVGIVGEFANDLIEAYSTKKEFELQPGLFQSKWHDILLQFPVADQISVSDRAISVLYLESLLITWNNDRSATAVVNGSIEALKELIEVIYSKAVESMGEKRALSIYKKIQGALSNRKDIMPEEQLQAQGLLKN